MLQQTSFPHIFFISSYAVQTNIMPPYKSQQQFYYKEMNIKIKGLTLVLTTFFGNQSGLEYQAKDAV